MEIVDIKSFVDGPILVEKDFLAKIDTFNWEKYRGEKALVRGCSDIVIPTWAYMVVASRLSEVASSIRYGNEHSNIVIYRRAKSAAHSEPE